MTSNADQARKDFAKNAAEATVNGYLGGVGSHPSLKGLRLVTPSLFGFGARQFEQGIGIADLWRQGRDRINDLLLAAVFEFTAALNPHDLSDTRPIIVEP